MLHPLLCLFLWGAGKAEEPLAVIVHPESGIQKLSRTEVTHLFLGRRRRLAPTLTALPVDLVVPTETRARFYRLLVQQSLPEINAYWARLYFSGQAQPPRQAQSVQEVLDMVAANKGAIGFVERKDVRGKVRVVLLLGSEP